MAACLPADMRGPQVKTPLLLLLLVLAARTGTVLCQHEDQEQEQEEQDVKATEAEPTALLDASSPTPSVTEASAVLATVEENIDDRGSGQHHSYAENPNTSDPENDPVTETTEEPISTIEDEDKSLFLLICLIPAVLVAVIIGMIVCCIFICRRRNKTAQNEELRKEDPYLDEPSAEKVPMPMFEEDVPSVLELEMEELDQWMRKESENAEEATQP